MPPIHPAVVHYPIALMTLSVIADLLGYFTNNPTLQATGTGHSSEQELERQSPSSPDSST